MVAYANDNPYGLAAGVMSKDQRTIDSLVRRLKAGTVWVNTYNVYDAGRRAGGAADRGQRHSVLVWVTA